MHTILHTSLYILVQVSFFNSRYDKRIDFNFHITHFPFLSSNIPSSPTNGVFYLSTYTIRPGLLLVWMFYFEGQATSQLAIQTGVPRGTLEIVIQEVLWSIRGSYSTIWSLPLTNDILTLDLQWLLNRSDFARISWPWYRAWPSPNYDWFPWSICNGCGMQAGNAYPSGHLVPSPLFGTCLSSNCWDQIPRNCHDFTRLFTLNTPWYFLDFAFNSN